MEIKLKKMSSEEFEAYLSFAIEDYARDKIQANSWSESEALARSKETFQNLLPEGLSTKKELLFSIYDDKNSNTVGYLWVHIDDKNEKIKFFIYDFIIFESFRNKGYGKITLEHLDILAKEMGVQEVGLHVFAHNKPAVHLYEKLGFNATDLTMVKKIEN